MNNRINYPDPVSRDSQTAHPVTDILNEIVGMTIESINLTKDIGTAIYGSQPDEGCTQTSAVDREPSLLALLDEQRKRMRKLYELLVDIRNRI